MERKKKGYGALIETFFTYTRKNRKEEERRRYPKW